MWSTCAHTIVIFIRNNYCSQLKSIVVGPVSRIQADYFVAEKLKQSCLKVGHEY